MICYVIEDHTAAVGAGADENTSYKLPISDFLVCLPTVSGKLLIWTKIVKQCISLHVSTSQLYST